MGRWTERAKQLQQEATHFARKGLLSFEPGMLVHYQIPSFGRGRHIGWSEQTGRVELIDEHGQGVVVTPLDEQEPWRWVAITHITKYTSSDNS